MGEPVIGFDARAAFLDPHRGFGRVARCLAEAMLARAPGRLVVFVPRHAQVPEPWYRQARAVVQLRRPRRGAFLLDGPAWAWTLRRHPADILYLPAWGVPPLVPVPVVATFHDATPLRFPSPPQRWKRRRLRRAIASLRRAEIVHAVSAHAASELAAAVPEARSRTRVVHWGVGPPFAPPSDPAPPGHLLFVGGADPHKNLDVILRMMALPGATDLPPLLVAGPAGSAAAVAARLRTLGIEDRVRLVPPCSDDELAELYRRALATLLPSLNEGFGLPALEAMACGCPVVAAAAGALPEVIGEGGVPVDPNAETAWLAAVLPLLERPQHRADVAARAVARAGALSWSRTARAMLGVLDEAAGASRGG